MTQNLNAHHILEHLSPEERVALLAFFRDSWAEIKRIGIDPVFECERLGVDCDAFASAAELISEKWNGKG